MMRFVDKGYHMLVDMNHPVMIGNEHHWKWDLHFLNRAQTISEMSKDPSTKVGCIIIGPDKETRTDGFNGFPRKVKDDERLQDRETKYKLIVHAEMNAILNAALIGVSLKGCTLYHTFGGSCSRCAVCIIQAGIKRVVHPPLSTLPDRWREDMELAKDLLLEAGVDVTEITWTPKD